MWSLAAVALLSTIIGPALTPAGLPPSDPVDVMAEFKAICLDRDGDLETTEDLAVERGYLPAQERLEAFRPLGVTSQQRFSFVWARQVDGVDVQVMARPGSFIGFGGERVYHDVCSVAVAPGHRGRLRNQVARYLGQDSFRQSGSSVFAWTPGPDGREPVRRSVFDNQLYALMKDRGLRMVTVAQHNDRVILSYFVPSQECRVLRDYSPTEPNIVCGVADP